MSLNYVSLNNKQPDLSKSINCPRLVTIMCNSNPLPLTPRNLTAVKPEEFYGTPKCEAFSDGKTFLLIDSVTGTEITLKGLEPKQVSALILAWRQGCFCGQTGEDLADLIALYGNL